MPWYGAVRTIIDVYLRAKDEPSGIILFRRANRIGVPVFTFRDEKGIGNKAENNAAKTPPDWRDRLHNFMFISLERARTSRFTAATLTDVKAQHWRNVRDSQNGNR